MMTLLRVVSLSVGLAILASAADLTGRWSAEVTTPNGDKRTTTYALIQDGTALTGYMSGPGGDTPFTNGKVSGNSFSFDISRETAEGVRTMPYSGHFEGDEATIKMPGFNGGPGREVVAKRVSSERPKPMPPKLKLGEWKPVPANGLALTPPMGWNSWNKFARRIDDKAVREIADAMVTSGMRDAGYVYVNIDDTWQGQRDAQGNLQANEKFPDMKALADYVHSKGLKIGIYSSPGPKTCAGYEGSINHEEQDAKLFAAWGIDYLKYDWCSARNAIEAESMAAAYAKMGHALQNSGRPIVYSLCQYGLQEVGTWGPKVGGNVWRTTGDIRDTWASMTDLGFDKQPGREKYAGPGHWNDPDMLEVGNGGMTDDEYRTHMSLWSILASPLLAGNDVRSMTPATKEILLNKEVIAVDQDQLGKQGVRVSKQGDLEIWAKPLADGSRAVGLFNRGDTAASMTVNWADLQMKGAKKVRDLWAHADKAAAGGQFTADVPKHGVVMLKVSQ